MDKTIEDRMREDMLIFMEAGDLENGELLEYILEDISELPEELHSSEIKSTIKTFREDIEFYESGEVEDKFEIVPYAERAISTLEKYL